MTRLALGLLLTAVLAAPAPAQVASYYFDNPGNRYAPAQAGLPALTAVNATSLSFVTDSITLGGTTYSNRTVLNRGGGTNNQAGVQVSTGNYGPGRLLPNQNVYSVDMVFSMTQASSYGRLLNANDSSDQGLYVQSQLYLYNVAVGSTAYTYGTNTYHHVVFTYDGSTQTAKGYLDGALEFTSTGATTAAAAGNADDVFRFFLDNTTGSFPNDYDTGRVASVRIWDHALSAGEAADAYANPFGLVPVPEPAGVLAVAGGVLAVCRLRRRRVGR